MEKKWQLADQVPTDQMMDLAQQLDCEPLFAAFCIQRGITSQDQFDRWMSKDMDLIHSPFLMADMKKAVERISSAILGGEAITIYGDYDADGVCSTTLLVECISQLGGQVDYYIPNRFKEGYGPNAQAFKRLIDQGSQLIITCDNGIQGHEAVDLAQDLGVDVIVTDHHQIGSSLPRAYAIIHPQHPDGAYPFGQLAGVGVAFKLAHALMDDFPYELLDLLAIGTVADLVDLIDENYHLVKWGIELARQDQRPGVLALLRQSETSPQDIDETAIAFRLAPRLNAAGRLGEADLAVDLLLSSEGQQADVLASQLEALNNQRKALTETIYDQAIDQLQAEASIQILYAEGWHEGVLGIVASRIVEATGQPALVLTLDSDRQMLKGSGRSLGSVNLYETLCSCQSYFESFGGHEMAAGLSFKVDQLDVIQEKLNRYVKDHYQADDLKFVLQADLKADLSDLTMDLVYQLNQLKPFGQAFAPPHFLIEGVEVSHFKTIGSQGQHLKCQLADGDEKIEAIAFSMGQLAEGWGDRPRVDLIAQLDINEWNGRKNLQCVIQDIRAKGVQVIDQRSSHPPQLNWADSSQAFVFFNDRLYAHMMNHHDHPDHFYLVNEEGLEDIDITEEDVSFVDMPASEKLMQTILTEHDFKRIYAVFYSLENVYLEGLAQRKDFAKVYKYIFSHQEIDYQSHRHKLAAYLDLPLNLLNHIIFVFIEAGYVKLDEGRLIKNTSIQHQDLSQSQTVLKRKSQLQMEERLLYSSAREMTDQLLAWSQGE